MSESKEHKKRYNLKLEYIAKFEKWLDREPPIIRFFAWHKWKKQRPTKQSMKVFYNTTLLENAREAREAMVFTQFGKKRPMKGTPFEWRKYNTFLGVKHNDETSNT